MAPGQVAVWFQNRRARWKTKQLETDFDRLKAAYDALAADHQGLLADNDRLRALVATSISHYLFSSMFNQFLLCFDYCVAC